MTDTYSDTRVVSILDRRKQLKRQRRSQFLKSAWRTFASLGLAVGLGWLFSRSEWQIRNASQVQILGNTQLSTQTLETFLPFSFPSSLLRVRPNDIKTDLERHTHVAQVLVSRQLFPPQVLIQVQERVPVALSPCRQCVLVADGVADAPIIVGPADLWLLDTEGVPLPYGSYPNFQQANKVPTLAVSHYLKPIPPNKAKALKLKSIPAQANLVSIDLQTQSQWKTLFNDLNRSPVKIQELDWQDPRNLVLKTELGVVHLGAFSSKIPEQLRVLDEMRALPQKLPLSNIKFIDLQNPDHPTVEQNPSAPVPKTQDIP
ncbi:MAG: FtsQ-type POTRA domain-containing protein [Thermosynechococcaceae cyanobacterium]